MRMKLLVVLSVVFLVSVDARYTGRWQFGNLTPKLWSIFSKAKETVACKLPFSSLIFSCDSSKPRFCGSYDCPDFYEKKLNISGKIVEDYTLRCYPKPYKWVSTTYDGRRIGKSEAFMRLFRYISGRNEKEMKIDMTVPVTKQMEPDDTSSSFFKENYTMSFFIPFKHQQDAPIPSEENVHLTNVEPFCAYVKVYGGWSSKWKVEKNYKNLVKDLKRDGLAEDYRTDVMYSAGYNDPREIWNRHNEIWLISKNEIPARNNNL